MGDVLPVEPWVGQDFYIPAYGIKVRERDLLKETYDITSVTYTESLTAIDSFDLTVNNWDPDQKKFKYSDAATFMPWSPVELKMGYYQGGRDKRRRMLTGEITTMTPNFPTSGGPTLAVRGLNLLHRFRLKQETQTFFDKKDTEIAQTLVGLIDHELRRQFPRLRLRIDEVDARLNPPREQKIPFLVMQNQYPILFLMERARRIGYDLTIEEMPSGDAGTVTFGFGPTSCIERPTYVLEWGKSLLSFQPTLRVSDQVAKVTVRGWSPGRKEPIQATATRDHLRGHGVVHPRDLSLAEPALSQEVSVDRPVSSQEEARRLAEQMLRQKASELVVAKGKTIGLPDLRAGVKLQVHGLGDRFSGPAGRLFQYVVTDTSHVFGDAGYTTDFTARMEVGPS